MINMMSIPARVYTIDHIITVWVDGRIPPGLKGIALRASIPCAAGSSSAIMVDNVIRLMIYTRLCSRSCVLHAVYVCAYSILIIYEVCPIAACRMVDLSHAIL